MFLKIVTRGPYNRDTMPLIVIERMRSLKTHSIRYLAINVHVVYMSVAYVRADSKEPQ